MQDIEDLLDCILIKYSEMTEEKFKIDIDELSMHNMIENVCIKMQMCIIIERADPNMLRIAFINEMLKKSWITSSMRQQLENVRDWSIQHPDIDNVPEDIIQFNLRNEL